MRALAALLLVGAAAPSPAQEDLRAAYDVEAYRLDLRLDPASRWLDGTVSIELVVVVDELDRVRLDLGRDLEVARTLFARGALLESGPARGRVVYHDRDDERLDCHLPYPVPRGKRITISVAYRGSPGRLDRAHGVRWERERSQGPADTLVDVALQNIGAHHLFPCKASRYHPEDRPRRVLVDLNVPAGLMAASCGRLVAREEPEPGRITWRWRHDYPLATYAIGIAVGAYESVTERLELPGLEQPVLLQYFVLPETLPAAKLQLAELEELLTVYSRAFGPWPFPGSKVGIAEGVWLTTDHSTLIGYGSSWPAWLAQREQPDPNARWNRGYDYVLAHQLAHEWWGNSVGAADWSHYWLHEGFATFAESLWIEHRHGRARADAFFRDLASRLPPGLRLLRAEAEGDARRAFSPVLYLKGSWVLHLARHYLDDDARFFRALRRFQADHRHGLATSRDLQRAFEAETDQDWGRFFDEWVYGSGTPRLTGLVRVRADRLEVEVSNEVAAGGSFRVPLDLRWREAGEEVHHRLWLEPGETREVVPCASPPAGVEVLHLQRLLGRHQVVVE